MEKIEKLISKKLNVFILSYVPVIVIILLGAFLRLYKIDQYMTFLGDEGRDVMIVRHMIVDHKWTLLGPTASVGGFFMGPVYYYFMLPFLWAWNMDPVGPAVMVALFGTVTITLLYIVGKAMFSARVGIIAALLYAVSPLVIAYSRSSWNPNIVPFFALMTVFLAWRVIHFRTWRELFWIGVCAGIGIQLHYTFLFLLVAVVIMFIFHGGFFRHFLKFLYGIIGFIVGFSPFLAFEIRHGFTNSRAIVQFVFTGKDTGFQSAIFLKTFGDIYFRLFGRLILRIPDGGMLGNLSPHLRDPWIMITWITAGVCGIFLVYSLFGNRQRKTGFYHAFLVYAYWLLIPLILFGLYKKNVYDYYFGIFFPLPFFLVALCIDSIMRRGILGYIAGFIVVLGLTWFNWQGRPFLYQPNNQLGQVKRIARAVLSHTDNLPYNFALITGGNSDHAYRYFLELWGRTPVTIENTAIDPDRNTVTNQLLVVCEDIFCQPLGNSLWEVAGFGRAEIAGVWNVSVVKVYKLVHYTGQ